jgi:hypothetical protein
VGDEHKAETLAALQLLEKLDDIGFCILVEIACWFIR